jgi:hypothetical protein
MTPSLNIPSGERGILRLFSLDMPAEQVRFLSEPGAAAQMLGVDDLDLAQTDIISLDDLADIGLPQFLIDGFSIPPDQIDIPALTALSGHVMLVRSRAFRNRATTLTPAPQLALVASFTEPHTDWSATHMQTTSAHSRPSPRVTRSETRRIGFALFAFTMVLVAAIVIAVAS